MGFTEFEKNEMKGLFRVDSEQIVEQTLPDDIILFLKSQNLMKQVRDYGIFPSKFRYRPFKAENIVLTFFMDPNFSIYQILNDLSYIITPPFSVKIDCSFVMQDSDGDLRYVWPQRNLALNSDQQIDTVEEFENLINEFKFHDHYTTLKNVSEVHQNQSCFDKSGYRPLCLLTTALYLSKTMNQ